MKTNISTKHRTSGIEIMRFFFLTNSKSAFGSPVEAFDHKNESHSQNGCSFDFEFRDKEVFLLGKSPKAKVDLSA